MTDTMEMTDQEIAAEFETLENGGLWESRDEQTKAYYIEFAREMNIQDSMWEFQTEER
jgi:hypothetical protein